MMKTFAELNFPGRLIAVEGLDGSCKSTQIYLLKRWLEAEGIKVYFSEWNSSELVKSATSKGKKRELLTPTTFSLIHATDFADRYERQILANLISNGIEALSSTRGGQVRVATRLLDGTGAGRGSEQIQLIVSDNGPGFREDILGQAFEPYVTSKARGTGLGLAIVKRIVEEHGGKITAENIPGGGARVSVVLPAIAERRTELRRERA